MRDVRAHQISVHRAALRSAIMEQWGYISKLSSELHAQQGSSTSGKWQAWLAMEEHGDMDSVSVGDGHFSYSRNTESQ